jgi:hypothetical protein
MTITLTSIEIATLTGLIQDAETVEDVLHKLLLPHVQKHAESRLQTLADSYRALSPEDQIEVLGVLKAWQDSKNALR